LDPTGTSGEDYWEVRHSTKSSGGNKGDQNNVGKQGRRIRKHSLKRWVAKRDVDRPDRGGMSSNGTGQGEKEKKRKGDWGDDAYEFNLSCEGRWNRSREGGEEGQEEERRH